MNDIEKLKIENAELEKLLADTSGALVAALFLISDIRRAVGDGNARLMQSELVAHCAAIYAKSKQDEKAP